MQTREAVTLQPSLPSADGSQATVGPPANGSSPRSVPNNSQKNQATGLDLSLETNGGHAEGVGSHACPPFICNCLPTAESSSKQASSRSSRSLSATQVATIIMPLTGQIATEIGLQGSGGRCSCQRPVALDFWKQSRTPSKELSMEKGLVPLVLWTRRATSMLSLMASVPQKGQILLQFVRKWIPRNVVKDSANSENNSSDSTQRNDDSSHQAISSEAQEVSYEKVTTDRIMKIVPLLHLVSAHLSDAIGITSLNGDTESPPEILYKDMAASNLSRSKYGSTPLSQEIDHKRLSNVALAVRQPT